MRFEKAQDPANTVRGLARAIELLLEVSPGIRLAGGLADARVERPAPAPIDLPLEWLDRKLGRAVSAEEVRHILESLQFGVEQKRPGVFSVTVPSWRATKDISLKDDLVEEVGRMIGYISITPEAPALPVRVPPMNDERLFHHAMRELTAAQGFDEVYNYSFLSEEHARKFGFDPAEAVNVLNPIATDQNILRPSLIPGIWKNAVENARYFDNFRLFEIGREIHKKAEGLPDEVTHLAAAVYLKTATTEHLFELKRLAECLAVGCEMRPAEARHYEHPARTAEVIWQDTVIGRLFEFHPNFFDGARVGVLDLDLDQVYKLRKRDRRYQPLRRFPSSAFDLSVVAESRALVGVIQKQILGFAGPGLEAIEFVRQYEGPPLPEGTKSVSYRLTVSSPDRTLSSEEVGTVRQQIIDGMRGLGYDLRV